MSGRKKPAAGAGKRNGQGPVTLKLLAERLDLGITTISDILLRNRTNYRAATIKRVQNAAAELGYRPNALAQGIRRGTTQTVGLLITMNILDPFFAEIVNRLEERFEKEKLMVLLSISDRNVERDRQVIEFFESRRVDGIIVGPVYPLRAVEQMHEHYRSTLPVVMFLAGSNPPVDAAGHPSHGAIGAMSAKFLLQQGHRKIGYLMCPEHPRFDVGDQPYRGFHDALVEAGVYREEWIWIDPLPIAERAFERMRRILEETPPAKRPTAIFCHNDYCAIGAMAALRAAGLSVPDDISIMGVDNIAASAFATPPLTTIDLKAKEIADATFELMMQRMKNPRRRRERLEVLPELVARETVKRMP